MKTVFFDVDTQLDFLYPAGALYVPGAETIVPAVSTLNRYAATTGSVLISTVDAHREDDPTFQTWPPHCVAGTWGQQKPASTLLDTRLKLGPDIKACQQIILEKQQNDCFTNVHLPALLEQLNAERYIVYGVVTEICVKCAVDGLLKTGRRVELVTDAVRNFDDAAANAMLSAFTQAGGILTTVSQVTKG